MNKFIQKIRAQFNKELKTTIRSIERFYGVKLNQLDRVSPLDVGYSLDADGQVTALSLYDCKIIDVAPLAKLTQLEGLSLISNQIIDVAPLAKLTQLKSLSLGSNQIIDVAPLANLAQLKGLSLTSNQISAVAPLANLTQLTELYLSYNQIIDVAPIANFTQLTILDLARNQIIDVAPIDKLTQLEHLDLSNNRIQNLPSSLLQLSLDWHTDGFHAKGLLLEGNSLQNPPLDVIKSGRQAIEAYYQSLEQGEKRELREAKLILLGEPDAGKSSIVRRLLYNKFDPNSQTTLGTDIHRWKFSDANDEEYRVNIWDFGGQDIQQSIHHLFLTEGALYLVVLDARRDESPLQWLQTINAFAAGATVLIAVNQIDLNAHPKLNQQELRAAYPNIAAVFYTSCKHDHGLTQLKDELKHRLAQLPSMGDIYPQKWYEIKEGLEREQSHGRHYMSMSSYRDFCTEHGMESAKGELDSAKTFLSVLDTIGTVRWFRNFEYFDYQVLNPSWLTIGLYHILINTEVKQRSGLVSRQQIKGILLYDIPKEYLERGYKYKERDVDFFVEAIQHYKFAFKVEHSDGSPRYRIPKGFPQNPPGRLDTKDYEGDDYRLYIIEFTSFAPAWLLHRLIVSLHRSIPEELYWYYGFVYRSAEGDTLVNLFEHERKLFIRVPKSAPNVYPLLRFCLFDIFADTMQLEMQEWVMFGEDNSARASLQELRNCHEDGVTIYRDHKARQQAPVAELLGLFPANIANADTSTALKELEILKTERQQERELIVELISLIKQLQTQPDETQQISTAAKIKGYMDYINTTAQTSTTAQRIIEALGNLLN